MHDNAHGERVSGERTCYTYAAILLMMFAPTLWFYSGDVLASLIGAGLIAGVPAVIGLVLTATRLRS